MKTLFASLIFLVIGTTLYAQRKNTGYVVPNHSDITKAIPFKDRFLLENFKKGTVYFRNGHISVAPLNYSYFHSQIQFIDPKNDTLLLADNNFIRRIVIDDLLFYYLPEHGHIQQIGDFDKIRLGRKQKLTVTDTERSQKYRVQSSGTGVTSYSSFEYSKGLIWPINPEGNLIMTKLVTYFWIDSNDRFFPASKSNLLKLLPRHRKMLYRYFEQHNVDFSNEADLTKLLDYCQSLQKETYHPLTAPRHAMLFPAP